MALHSLGPLKAPFSQLHEPLEKLRAHLQTQSSAAPPKAPPLSAGLSLTPPRKAPPLSAGLSLTPPRRPPLHSQAEHGTRVGTADESMQSSSQLPPRMQGSPKQQQQQQQQQQQPASPMRGNVSQSSPQRVQPQMPSPRKQFYFLFPDQQQQPQQSSVGVGVGLQAAEAAAESGAGPIEELLCKIINTCKSIV